MPLVEREVKPEHGWGSSEDDLLGFWADFKTAALQATQQPGLDMGSDSPAPSRRPKRRLWHRPWPSRPSPSGASPLPRAPKNESPSLGGRRPLTESGGYYFECVLWQRMYHFCLTIEVPMTPSSDATRLVYDRDHLLSTHDYAELHDVDGRTLHGGFLADGAYQPPRALGRVQAMDAWQAALEGRGGMLFGAEASLLGGGRLPNAQQHLVLLRNGIDDVFWNTLTVIGKIEARGAVLGQLPVPDLVPHVVEDVSQMAIGHLGKGMFEAHGIDEGGIPDEGIGGHDEMWFAARDLAFGAGAHPEIDPPDNIGRPDTGERYLPEIAPDIEGLFSFIANLLIIEFRAEIGFADTQLVLRTPDLFDDRRAQAELAAEIVGRIRVDEEIHVRSLNLYLGELRNLTLRTVDGGRVRGAELIDRFWSGMVRWASVDKPAFDIAEARIRIDRRISKHPEADRVRSEFAAVGDRDGH
jgi:hypothetical protein